MCLHSVASTSTYPLSRLHGIKPGIPPFTSAIEPNLLQRCDVVKQKNLQCRQHFLPSDFECHSAWICCGNGLFISGNLIIAFVYKGYDALINRDGQVSFSPQPHFDLDQIFIPPTRSYIADSQWNPAIHIEKEKCPMPSGRTVSLLSISFSQSKDVFFLWFCGRVVALRLPGFKRTVWRLADKLRYVMRCVVQV